MECIVAVDQQWGIGKNGEQLLYIPQDLQHFKEITWGKTIILGRKTLQTFPGGKPLKGRNNIILSRNACLQVENAMVCNDLSCLPKDGMVVGGGEIYAALLPFCQKAYVTHVSASFEADAFFPNLEKDSAWKCVSKSDAMQWKEYSFFYAVYERIEGTK